MKKASTFEAVFLRSYSRRNPDQSRETWEQCIDRSFGGLADMARYTPEQYKSVQSHTLSGTVMMSGRWMWVGGTEWVTKPENFLGSYNCSSMVLDEPYVFSKMMSMAMQGTGTGAVVELDKIRELPPIKQQITVTSCGEYGFGFGEPHDETRYTTNGDVITMTVGDSREGWCAAVQFIIDLAMELTPFWQSTVIVDVSNVRSKGKKLKGFGGVSNPSTLKQLFPRLAEILNGAFNRDYRLNSVECCLISDECANVVVAGNIRRSAAIKQGSVEDVVFATAKDNLWIETDGVWSVDAKRAAHRMSNHTRVFHHKPNFDEVKEAVTKQFNSGEGAIMYAPEAIARCNADLLPTNRSRYNFIAEYEGGQGGQFLMGANPDMDQRELEHRMNRYGFNPCFAAGTMVMTRAGHFPIETLVGKVVEVWDGNEWVEIDNFRITGENQPVYVLEMGVGESITATGTHRFILENGESRLLKELVPGDRLMLTKLVIKAIYKKSVSADVKSVTKLSEIADKVYCCTVPTNNQFTLSNGLVVGQCAEILGKDFMCNLAEVHLNLIDFADYKGQISAFKVASLIVAPLLKHVFQDERQRYSRTIDPIVGVSFTGLFDFFAKGFGLSWLEWWQAGRPNRFNRYVEGMDILKTIPEDWLRRWDKDHDECDIAMVFRFVEKQYLEMWRIAAESQVAEYCNEQGLRRPNRCTTVQPAGSKSLLTGASCGWHPPKAMNYIRRITFAKNDPVALTLIDRGYSVVPGQNDRDESGALLNDPFSPLCTEWLVEMPTQAGAGSVPGSEDIDPNMFSAVAQFDFYMQVQKFYTRHNTSATIELREDEIGALSSAIHMAIDDGYISAALLPRYDAPFPRLPFEAIAKGKYEELMKEVNDRAIISEEEFMTQLRKYDSGEIQIEGPAGCDSDKCLSSDTKTR